MVWAARASGNHTHLLTSAQACLRAEAERAELRLRVLALRSGLVRGSRRGAARRGEVCSVGEGQLFTRGFEVRRESCAEGSQADFWPFRPQEGSLLPSFLELRWADASAHSFLQLLQSFLLPDAIPTNTS